MKPNYNELLAAAKWFWLRAGEKQKTVTNQTENAAVYELREAAYCLQKMATQEVFKQQIAGPTHDKIVAQTAQMAVRLDKSIDAVILANLVILSTPSLDLQSEMQAILNKISHQTHLIVAQRLKEIAKDLGIKIWG